MEESIDLTGKTAVITGATAGIGLSAALALTSAGAHVLGVGRNEQRCRAAEERIRTACPGAVVNYLIADLSLQSQVRRLAQDITRELSILGIPRLDMLVNNAGLYSEKYVKTAEGI